jgi:Mn2+/Fe2+ NRAMP family transporter
MVDLALATHDRKHSARPNRRATIGPGFLAGASANDPTTVGTIAVIGATSGYALVPAVLVLLPMLAAVQAIAATVGGACRVSVQGAVVRRFGMRWGIVSLAALALVNLATLVADVQAGSESLSLLTGVAAPWFVVPFALLASWIVLRNDLVRVERALSVVPVLFVAYLASAVLARPDAGALLRASLATITHPAPGIALSALALLGTTLTGYVFVWESIQVAVRRPDRGNLGAFRLDAAVGMIAAGSTMIVILIASAATAGREHVVVRSAADVALALRPLAGPLASQLFGAGLFASALLAVPILTATTAYAAGETFGWERVNDRVDLRGRGCAWTVLGSIAIAVAFAFAGLPLLWLLIGASIVAGIATPLSLAFLMCTACDRQLMGDARIGRGLAVAGWAVVAVSSIVAIGAAAGSHVWFGGSQ